MGIKGIWLPIITPFKDDEIDLKSYKKMIDHYIGLGIDGLMPVGTTGESPTISDDEYTQMLEATMEYVNGRVPVYFGFGGNYTNKLTRKLRELENSGISGILSVSPYYSRPDQRGIHEHFKRISEATDLDIVLYNIPYRTGRNMENETILRLAEMPNINSIKDACGDIKQSLELLHNRPKDFSIMTGEDAFFYITLVYGGQGGIMASAHMRTDDFRKVFNCVAANDHKAALETWEQLSSFIPLLFAEPNPSPIKYCLSRMNLIDSAETRLPIMPITETLAGKLNNTFNF